MTLPICPKCGKSWIGYMGGPDVKPGQTTAYCLAVYRERPSCGCGISRERIKTFHLETP